MAQYYVKAGGGTGSGLDDANAWSLAHYNSISGTLSNASIVSFKKGDTMYGTFNTNGAQTYNSTSYGSGANPIITGVGTLGSWTRVGATNVWTSPLTMSGVVLRMVTVDGNKVPYGRTAGYTTYPGGTNDILEFASLSVFPTGTATLATGTAVRSGNAVASVTVNTGGKGYLPVANYAAVDYRSLAVTFTGGGGTGATGTAVIVNSVVNSVTITNGGSGYTTNPTVVMPTPIGANDYSGYYQNVVMKDINASVNYKWNGTSYISLSYPFVRDNSLKSNNQSITGANGLANNYIGGEVVIKGARWTLDRHNIIDRSGDHLRFGNAVGFGNSGADVILFGNGYFIQNHKDLLTADTNWWHDAPNNLLYMWFTSDPNAAGRVVKAGKIEEIIASINNSVTITAIDFQYANYGIVMNAGQSYVTLNQCNFRYFGGDAFFGGASANHIIVNQGSIYDCNTNGFIVDNTGNYTTLDGVFVKRCGDVGGMGRSGDGAYNGIFAVSDNLTVQNCDIEDTGQAGIYSQCKLNMLIDKNKIRRYCKVLDDKGGIYSYTELDPAATPASNLVISKNRLDDGYDASAGTGWYTANNGGNIEKLAHGIYLDGNTNHVTVQDNVLNKGYGWGIFDNGNPDNQFLNNTVLDFIHVMHIGIYHLPGASQAPWDYVRNLKMTGNVFVAKTGQYALWVDQAVNDAINNILAATGDIDNNTYTRPIDDNQTIMVNKRYGGGPGQTPMALGTTGTAGTWKNFATGSKLADGNSIKSTVTTSVDSNLLLADNFTAASAPYDFPGYTYKDLAGTVYNNSITLPAYGSKILILQGSVTTKTMTGKASISGGAAATKRILVHGANRLVHSGSTLVHTS